MITLTDCGTTGLQSTPVEIDETQIASIAADPVRPDEPKLVVTLTNGQWYLVSESLSQIDTLILEAKGRS
jgi:uncharacterized protein YlzI (FlbEa/FlbD family)